MATNTKLGKQGEAVAVTFLEQNGYSILEKNWRIKHKEIDIIARKDRVIHIVEVKTRNRDFLLEPEQSVSRRKQKLLTRAADAYVNRKRIRHDVQFDIISIVYDEPQYHISHIEDAFSPMW